MARVPASPWASPDLLQRQLEGGLVAAGRLSPTPPDAHPNGGGGSSMPLPQRGAGSISRHLRLKLRQRPGYLGRVQHSKNPTPALVFQDPQASL